MPFLNVVLLISRDEVLVILYTILPVASSTVSNLLVGSIFLVDSVLIILSLDQLRSKRKINVVQLHELLLLSARR